MIHSIAESVDLRSLVESPTVLGRMQYPPVNLRLSVVPVANTITVGGVVDHEAQGSLCPVLDNLQGPQTRFIGPAAADEMAKR